LRFELSPTNQQSPQPLDLHHVSRSFPSSLFSQFRCASSVLRTKQQESKDVGRYTPSESGGSAASWEACLLIRLRARMEISILYHGAHTTSGRDGFALKAAAKQASRPEEKEESV